MLFLRGMNARLAVLMFACVATATCIPPDGEGPLGPPELNTADALPQRDVYWLHSFSGMESKRGMIITDARALQVAWDTVFANYEPGQKPLMPAIDFAQNVVLLASAGQTPTQLLWFRITLVRERPEHLAVLVESQWPACGGLPLVTTPVHIVSVPRVATQAVFEFVDNVEPCS